MGGLMIGTKSVFLGVLFSVALVVSIVRAEKIRTSVPGLNLNYLTVFAAEERKFFRDEGLENEIIVIGGPAGIAALVSGDVDYSGRRSEARRSKRSFTKPKSLLGISSFTRAFRRPPISKGKRSVYRSSATAKTALPRCTLSAWACRLKT
jgi:hypothetical protein